MKKNASARGISAFAAVNIVLFCFCAVSFSGNISYDERSLEWQKRNAHLIPDKIESAAIEKLDQGYSLAWRSGGDADGDGVPDAYDPSPSDWRENGYNPFGVLEFLSWDHSWNSYKYDKPGLEKIVKLMKKAGVTCVRFDFLWQDMEPQEGVWSFGKYDYLVDLLTQNQIRILGVLSYSTSWSGDDWNYPPYDNATFVNYASRVISRYKDKVKYWEIWNEPDSTTYWKVRDEMKGYTRLLKEVYTAAKRADPSCKIVLGGLTSEGFFALKNIYRNGGKDYFDVMNIHPFTNPLLENRIRYVKALYNNVRKEMAKNGDGHKKIWFTEVGCPGVDDPSASYGWWEGLSPTEKQQARWVREIYTEFIKFDDVEKVFWAFFRDNNKHFNNDVDYFGLVRWDYSTKSGFSALRRCSREWKKLAKKMDWWYNK